MGFRKIVGFGEMTIKKFIWVWKERAEVIFSAFSMRFVLSLHGRIPSSISSSGAHMAWMPAEIIGQIMPVAAGAAARNAACKGKDALIWFKGPDI